MNTTALIGIPPGQGKPLLQRLAIVWAMALLIALMNWSSHSNGHLDQHLVYSYAISTLIWAFTDLPRLLLRRWLHAEPPHYWPPVLRATGMLAVGIALGYAQGTWLGDLYAGHSTWALLELNRQRFVGMLASSVAISIAFVGFFYQRSKAEALQRQAGEAKLMLLQSQLEPHMLFNTLAHLRALVALQPTQAVAMIDHLDDYLRRALQASRHPLHPLSEEFARLHDYLSLMQLRMGERLRFTLSLPTELAAQPVPSLILQPLVENAIRHGLEPAVLGGTLTVRAHSAQGQLRIDVCDSGLGRSQHPPSEGYGLTHVRERLQALWGPCARLELTTPPSGGTTASLCWPLHPTSRAAP